MLENNPQVTPLCTKWRGRGEPVVNSAFIGPVLEPDVRNRLKLQLEKILYGTNDQHTHFLEAAELAIDWYKKVGVPAAAEQETRLQRFNQLAEAINALTLTERGLVSQGQALVMKDRDILAPEHFGTPLGGPGWAEITLEALAKLTRKRRKRNDRTGPAMSKLLEDFARAYQEAFGEQPSAAREGYFLKMTAVILDAANPPTIGENGVRPILERAQLAGERPRRGRRPRRPASK